MVVFEVGAYLRAGEVFSRYSKNFGCASLSQAGLAGVGNSTRAAHSPGQGRVECIFFSSRIQGANGCGIG